VKNSDDEIVKKIKDLRDSYKVELEDHEEESLSFLDKINNLITSIFNDSTLSVYSVFSQENLDSWKKKRLSRSIKGFLYNNVKNILYMTLLVTITAFLVSEALDFYSVEGLIDTKTYVKAVLTEICFIFLSGYRSEGKWQTAAVSVLRVGIFCLMLFAITSKTLINSSKVENTSNVIQQQVILLEEQIKEKKDTIKYYKDKNWPVTTKQMIKEKDILLKKLIILKEKQTDGASTKVSRLIVYKSYGRAFFRVLLLFISILITRRIFTF